MGIDITRFTPEQRSRYIEVLKTFPLFAKEFFDKTLRDWQQTVVATNAKRFALRVARRGGKTELVCMMVLWLCFTNGKVIDPTRKQRYKVIVMAPLETHLNDIYQNMLTLINTSKDFQESIEKPAKAPAFLRFKNGAVIQFLTAGTKSGMAAMGIRGKWGDLIWVEEADYCTDDDMTSALAILGQSDDIRFIMTSTPSGKRGIYYETCVDPEPRGFKSFHYNCWEAIPDWNEERDRQIRMLIGPVRYEHEQLADFGSESFAVFKKEKIDTAKNRHTPWYTHSPKSHPNYGYLMSKLDSKEHPIVIGVDWDKYHAATQIVVVQFERYDDKDYYMRVIARHEIPIGEYTLHNATKKIVMLNDFYQPDYIYCDRGYGEGQIENLKVVGLENPETKLHDKVIGVHFGQSVDILDPHTRVRSSTPIKPLMVNRLTQMFDDEVLILSPHDHFMTLELNEYRVKRMSQNGQPIFSSKNEHAIDALMLAVYGITEHFLNMGKVESYAEMQPISNILKRVPENKTSPLQKRNTNIDYEPPPPGFIPSNQYGLRGGGFDSFNPTVSRFGGSGIRRRSFTRGS